MVNIIHKGDNNDKIIEIIEIAQKRFGMYGLGKTTMKEIAEDLGLSKGSLYYYFPDKEQLYKVVIEKEQEVFTEKLMDVLSKIERPEDMLKEYVRIRMQYFRKLLNLSRFRMEDYSGLKPIMADLRERFQKIQLEIITDILKKGIEKKVFHLKNDTKKTAELYLDLLIGLGHSMMKKNDIFYLENDEYNQVVRKAKDFTEIFIKGLLINS